MQIPDEPINRKKHEENPGGSYFFILPSKDFSKVTKKLHLNFLILGCSIHFFLINTQVSYRQQYASGSF